MKVIKKLILIAVVAVAGLLTSCGPTTYVYDPYPSYGYRTGYYLGNIYTRPLPPPPPPRYHAPAPPKPQPPHNHNHGGRGRR